MKMCQTRGGLKNTLTCSEPSGFNILGPHAPIFGSALSLSINVSIVPGGTSVSRLRRKTKGDSVTAKAWLLAAPQPRFSELLKMRNWPLSIITVAVLFARSCARLSSADALSMMTISYVGVGAELTMLSTHLVRRLPPFQLTMIIERS